MLALPEQNAVVIYHRFHGNAVIASKDTVKYLELFNSPQTEEFALEHGGSEQTQKLFSSSCFLVPEGTDERLQLKELNEARASRIANGSLVANLRFFSANCNFACSYCSVTHIDRAGYENLIAPTIRFPWKTAKQAVDAFLDLTKRHHHKVVTIRFFGGEPLLDWPTYRRVVEYVSAQTDRPEVDFYLNTNGALITSEIAAFLKTHNIKTIVSLDGVGEVNDRLRVTHNGRGTYAVVQKGIEELRVAGVDIHLNMTLTQQNTAEIHKMIDLCKKLGAKDVGIDDLCFVGNEVVELGTTTKRQADAIIDAWSYGRKIGIPVLGAWVGFRSFSDTALPLAYCAGNGEEVCVDHSGKVFPCYGIPCSIGELHNFDSCFVHPVYQTMALRMVGNIPHCEGCELEGPCGGGCAADAFAATETVTSISRDKCEMRKTITRELIQQWAIAQGGTL
ncbi:MAG: radical SAM protein [Candidatus Pacebacteria bacterium]|nr:radical SAM protein [Candidatus Paceibacterota bacterium]